MSVKQAGLVLILLWLTGCSTPNPISQEQKQVQAQAQVQEPAHEPATEKAPEPLKELALTELRMLAALEYVATLEPKNAKQIIENSQSASNTLSPGDRFEHVLLLSQKGADDKSLKRARALLDKLEADAKEPSVQKVLRLLQRNLLLEQQYRTERRKTVELQKKIEHLKGLEQQLDESNRLMQEPLGPKLEDTR